MNHGSTARSGSRSGQEGTITSGARAGRQAARLAGREAPVRRPKHHYPPVSSTPLQGAAHQSPQTGRPQLQKTPKTEIFKSHSEK